MLEDFLKNKKVFVDQTQEAKVSPCSGWFTLSSWRQDMRFIQPFCLPASLFMNAGNNLMLKTHYWLFVVKLRWADSASGNRGATFIWLNVHKWTAAKVQKCICDINHRTVFLCVCIEKFYDYPEFFFVVVVVFRIGTLRTERCLIYKV